MRRPIASTACISYWVMSESEFVAFWSGMSSVSGSRLMTIPAACVEAFRATDARVWCLSLPARAGVVAFAGKVGRSRSVAVEHPGTRRTTYAYLRRLTVHPGLPVHRGDVVGLSGGTGPGHEPGVVPAALEDGEGCPRAGRLTGANSRLTSAGFS